MRRPPSHALPVAVAVATVTLLTACDATVLHTRDEGAANAALSVLFDAGLEPRKAPGREGFEILVDRSDLRAAVRALSQAGLPRSPPDGYAQVLQAAGLVPSRAEERVRLVQGAAGEVARTLLTLPGVVDARVHLAARGLGATGLPGTTGEIPAVEKASVLLRVLPGSHPTPEETDAVRALVAGAVAGLDPGHVEVIVVGSRPAASGQAPGHGA